MPPPKISDGLSVALFGMAGLGLGFLWIGLLDAIFYTTKPLFFLDGWHLLLPIPLFSVSFSMIPVVAANSKHTKLIWFLLAWVCTLALAAFLVSVSTAIVHHQTLNVLSGLIPVGAVLVPIVPGAGVVLLAKYRRVRHETGAP